jgi:DNA polymerase-3 subunit gamma/tau
VALALYRKYRPRTFAEVIGQEHVTEPLSQALRSGRLHHAYLFSGPRGCGKTSSARILARSLNCEQGPTPEPCGVCVSCRSLANDGAGSIDVIEIDAASHGGVDDARELREKAFFAPANSRYKIYVIDEAHMVSSAGFNALLKLVEEPPEYVKFIFATTEPEKVLGTIRSRTHHYPFRLIPPAVLRPYIQQLTEAEGVHVEPAVFPLVVRAGGGSARDTLSVLDQLIAGAGPDGVSYTRAVSLLGVTDVALIDEMCDAVAAGDGAAAYRTIDRVAEAGHDPRRFASDLLERFRDLIILQQVPDATTKGLIDGPADQLEAMTAQAGRLGPATLSRCADIVHNGLVEMRGTTAPRLLLELVTARMLLPGAEDSTGALLQRLERMERRLAQGGEPFAVRDEPAPPISHPPVSHPPVSGSPVSSPPVSSAAPVSAAPAAEPAPSAGGGGGLSAARAAAAAASRKSATTTATRRPAAASPAAAPGAVASPAVAPQPAAAPVSAPPEPSAPSAASASSAAPPAASPARHAGSSTSPASVPDVVEPAEAVAASQPTAPPPGTAEALSGPADSAPETAAAQRLASTGMPSDPEDYDDEPPWDDEPDYEPAPEQSEPEAMARPADPSTDGPAHRPTDAAALSTDGPARRLAEADSSAAPAGGRALSGERAGLLPDAPEEPGAAAVADVPGQLTVDGVREAWPEIITAIKQQPNGKIAGPMAASAVVRALEGDTLVLVFQHPNLVERISRFTSLITDALYETLGSRWEIRCEVGSGGSSVPAARVSSRRDAPPNGGGRPPRNEAAREPARAQVSAPPRSAPGAQQAQAAAARPPQARRQETESPSAGDDDWPEPAKPGGLTPSTSSAAVEEDDDEDWPEVRPVGGTPDPAPADQARADAARARADVAGARADMAGADVAGHEPQAGEISPTRVDPAADAHRDQRAAVTAPVPGGVIADGVISGGADPADHGSADWPEPARTGPPESAHPAQTGPTSAAPTAAPARPDAVPTAPTRPEPVGPAPAGPEPAGPAQAGPGSARPAQAGPGSARPGPAVEESARTAPARPEPARPAAPAAESPAARAARNAAGGAGGGLAAARAAVAAAAAARQNGGRAGGAPAAPAAAAGGGNGNRAWSDGSPTEEAPYDPEFDGPAKAGGPKAGGPKASYEGFDPGDEPLDDVLDEKTARESGEQQAMRLLQELLGAEKIGES